MTERLCLPARIGGDEVARHFSRRRPANLFGLRARPVRVADPGDPSSRVPPFVERLWMPAYAVRLRVVGRGGRRGHVWAAVDASAGQVSVFQCESELAARELNEDSFPPTLDETQAVAAARHGLLQFTLRRRGHKDKPIVEEVEEIKLYHFPVWVLYYRRGRRALDLKVVDGYTGQPAGAKVRVAVVNALIADRKQRTGSATR